MDTSHIGKMKKISINIGVNIICGIGKFGLLFPFTRKKIYKQMRRTSYANTDDDFKETLFKKKMKKTLKYQFVMDFGKTVSVKKNIPDLPVFKLSTTELDATDMTLREIQRPGVPLVINFGSCS